MSLPVSHEYGMVSGKRVQVLYGYTHSLSNYNSIQNDVFLRNPMFFIFDPVNLFPEILTN